MTQINQTHNYSFTRRLIWWSGNTFFHQSEADFPILSPNQLTNNGLFAPSVGSVASSLLFCSSNPRIINAWKVNYQSSPDLWSVIRECCYRGTQYRIKQCTTSFRAEWRDIFEGTQITVINKFFPSLTKQALRRRQREPVCRRCVWAHHKEAKGLLQY